MVQRVGVVEQQGWTLDAAFVGIAGTGLTFGMWWVYYIVPSAQILAAHRNRAFVWGYGHMVIVIAIGGVQYQRDRIVKGSATRTISVSHAGSFEGSFSDLVTPQAEAQATMWAYARHAICDPSIHEPSRRRSSLWRKT